MEAADGVVKRGTIAPLTCVQGAYSTTERQICYARPEYSLSHRAVASSTHFSEHCVLNATASSITVCVVQAVSISHAVGSGCDLH